jgi:hypothetical protein
MKLKNNSAFRGGLIVLTTQGNLLKTHRLIEVSSRGIRLTHFEVYGLRSGRQNGMDEMPGDTAPAKLRSHRQIEDFVFTRDKCTGYQEADHVTF